MFTIKSLSIELSLTQQYVRKMIHIGKLKSTLVPIKEDSKIMRHEISQSQVDDWNKIRGERVGKREDGRMKFTIYLNSEELSTLTPFIEDLFNDESEGLFFRGQKKK